MYVHTIYPIPTSPAMEPMEQSLRSFSSLSSFASTKLGDALKETSLRGSTV